MKRICEELSRTCVLAPQAVATATPKTTDFVDVSNVPEVEFLISTGALASGKKLTVGIYTADSADGANAVKAGETVFTAVSALTSALVTASYKTSASGGRYVGVKFEHDAAAAVVCSITASVRCRELPAANGWTMKV